jgi:hypothetical protein
VLRQQVIDERESQKKSCSIGHHAQPRTKLRRMFTTLHQRYLKCKLLYAKDQRQEVNRQELTHSLNYQARALVCRMKFCGMLKSGILLSALFVIINQQ